MTTITEICPQKTTASGRPGDEAGSLPWHLISSLDRLLPMDAVCESHVPEHMLLGSLRDHRLRVVHPLNVRFAKEDKQVIAEATDINEFGFGDNPSDALVDLQRAIAELYVGLETDKDRLGPDLQRVWTILEAAIRRL